VKKTENLLCTRRHARPAPRASALIASIACSHEFSRQ
jgi:hypothetical protein